MSRFITYIADHASYCIQCMKGIIFFIQLINDINLSDKANNKIINYCNLLLMMPLGIGFSMTDVLASLT